ncbi:MAG: csoR 2 [Bacillales bacterium]|jgi:DNA-binding FrmR family transcriptional regulator|nr:csoR 2 [Bacillales bacterium]
MENKKISESCCNDIKSHRPEKLNHNLGSRLNRIEGQIKGIKGMIEKGTYCDDILNQISAVQSALSSVSKMLLENHIKTCVSDKLLNGDEEVIEELIKTIGKIK